MARDITAITTLTAKVTFAGPAHIGADSALTGEAAPLLRDVSGRPIVPGTTLAGALRAVLGSRGADLSAWGSAEDDGAASRVVVHDSVIEPIERTAVSHRDGVAIDRALGSTVDERLYSREIVTTGSAAELIVEVHSEHSTESADLQLLAAIRALLNRGALSIGARTSRGMGRLKLVKAEVTQRRFDTPAGFWASRAVPITVSLPTIAFDPDDILDIELDWSARTPVFVAAGGLGTTLPKMPIMEPDPAGPKRLRQVLPGTSIAGALRSHAEMICRTISRTVTPPGFDAQLASTPLVTALFGGPAGEQGTTASPLWVEDCLSTTTVATNTWLEMLGPTPHRSLGCRDGAELRLTDHTSVDRWTGGAADGRLFAVVEPHGFHYGPIRLRLDRARLPHAVRDAATMLLLVTVREFVEGRIPLGNGTHRGLGAVTVARLRMHGAGLQIDGDRLNLIGLPNPQLRAAWQQWIRSSWEHAA